MEITAAALIQTFGLAPHPEGGFYKETYRSNEIIASGALPERFTGERTFSTAIYFLLVKGSFSAFHRIKSDECWHFYHGDLLNIYVIHPDGKSEIIHLGNDIANGHQFQAVVPAGCWFASETTGDLSFVGCTVAPGFDFNDFEMANAAALTALYPQHENRITMFCRD